MVGDPSFLDPVDHLRDHHQAINANVVGLKFAGFVFTAADVIIAPSRSRPPGRRFNLVERKWADPADAPENAPLAKIKFRFAQSIFSCSGKGKSLDGESGVFSHS